MRLRSERRSIERLSKIITDLRDEVSRGYEHRAKNCLACETPGACCLDAHFVNVRISRLEAAAINKFIDTRPDADAIRERIDGVITKYGLTADAANEKFACPLYERGVGCLVHDVAKPVPCIVHACYESHGDMPPSTIADAAELAIDRLNVETYGNSRPLLPIPLAIKCGERK